MGSYPVRAHAVEHRRVAARRPEWWESNLHKLLVAVALAMPAGVYLVENGLGGRLEHQMLFDYLPFIILLCSLFVVTGGIAIEGDIEATPKMNTLILAVGFLLASFMGTTGRRCCSYVL